MDDGTAGLWRIKAGGGITIVQDPTDAEAPSMPVNALRAVKVDYCVPVAEIAGLLVKLENQEATQNNMTMKDEKTKTQIEIAVGKNALETGSLKIGEVSRFACPECHGVLSRIIDGDIARFRCHTGHAYSVETLLASLTEKVEESLYGALRGMDETILLLNHIGDHYAEANDPQQAALHFRKAQDEMGRTNTIRKALFSNELNPKNNDSQDMEMNISARDEAKQPLRLR